MNESIGSYVYVRVNRDNIWDHIPAWIAYINGDTLTVCFRMYGREEHVEVSRKELRDTAEEVLLGLKEY